MFALCREDVSMHATILVVMLVLFFSAFVARHPRRQGSDVPYLLHIAITSWSGSTSQSTLTLSRRPATRTAARRGNARRSAAAPMRWPYTLVCCSGSLLLCFKAYSRAWANSPPPCYPRDLVISPRPKGIPAHAWTSLTHSGVTIHTHLNTHNHHHHNNGQLQRQRAGA